MDGKEATWKLKNGFQVAFYCESNVLYLPTCGNLSTVEKV